MNTSIPIHSFVIVFFISVAMPALRASGMRAEVAKDDTIKALQRVDPVVQGERTLPILKTVLLSAENGALKLRTTDLDVAIEVSVPASVDAPGVSAVPAERLAAILEKMPGDRISLQGDGAALKLSSGDTSIELVGEDPAQFPGMARLADARSFSLPQPVLKHAFERTGFACSRDESRYVLNGVRAECEQQTLTMVGTDGRRLAMFEHQADLPHDLNFEVIIPNKTVGMLREELGENGEVTIRFSDSQAVFEFDGGVVSTKLIEGNYPNFRQVIPDSYKASVGVGREEFLAALETVGEMKDETSRAVTLQLEPGGLRVSARSAAGQAERVIKLAYAGDGISANFNGDYLVEVLRAVGDREIKLELIDALSPGVVRAGTSYRYVVMPLRVQE